MKKVLILGAGRSSGALIKFLYREGINNAWQITVADFELSLAKAQTVNLPQAEAITFNILNTPEANQKIANSDLVISLLPPSLHPEVAKLCLINHKHLLNASYISPEMAKYHTDAKANGLLFLNECGLDPGIDHLSAMKIIDGLQKQGAEITTFKSWCGGLVAPESDNNPWGYKFSWNPRNVILAGMGTATWQENGKRKFRPYNQLFQHPETVRIEGLGTYEGYANRDSLGYKGVYGLENTNTIIRGTLRRSGFCKAWALLVQLGLTDDNYTIDNLTNCTWANFLEMFLPELNPKYSLRKKVGQYLNIDHNQESLDKLEWLGLFSDKKLNLNAASPAQALQSLLEEKWKLEPGDNDLVVMQHRFDYQLHGKTNWIESSFYLTGDGKGNTAMSKTVGLPLALAAVEVLKGNIKERGVIIPKSPEFYEPILKGLEREGIIFQEITG